MKILLTGASGFVGKRLYAYLRNAGHTVVTLSHSRGNGDFHWHPKSATVIPEGALDGAEAVIHLSGAPVTKKWTPSYKKVIHDSRIQSTKLLTDAIVEMQKPPKVFICASGVNIAPYVENEGLADDANVNGDFLAGVSKDWELATRPAEAVTRVVNLRIGLVLDPKGGILKDILPVFRRGLGGKLGSGQQSLSWIGLVDLVSSIMFIMNNDEIKGPVNAVAPTSSTNAEFTHAIASKLNRPAWIPVPKFLIKRFFGEMGEELMLSNIEAEPTKLANAGFDFQQPKLEDTF